METLKTENRTAFAQAIKRRDGAMREMLGMGSDSVGDTEGDKHHKPQVGIWRIPGNPDRSGAGWTDTVDARVQRREDRRLRRNSTAVSGVWLFLLSSVLKRNGLLSLHLWSRREPPAGQR